jgi:hypothetical protein
MSSTLVPVDEPTEEALEQLSRSEGRPVIDILRSAVEDYRARALLEGASGDFARLRRDPTAWAEELEERRLWESTLGDGLTD